MWYADDQGCTFNHRNVVQAGKGRTNDNEPHGTLQGLDVERLLLHSSVATVAIDRCILGTVIYLLCSRLFQKLDMV